MEEMKSNEITNRAEYSASTTESNLNTTTVVEDSEDPKQASLPEGEAQLLEFDNEKMTELREAFCLFDKEGDGKIKVDEMGTVLRACGFCPSESLVNSFIKSNVGGESKTEQSETTESDSNALFVDKSGSGKHTKLNHQQLDFEEFLNVCKRMPKPVDEEEELINAFRVFDKRGTGKLFIEDFRQIMTTMGERLSDQEFEELMKLIKVDKNGEFEYNELINALVEGIK
ncbi:MAG: hypothetical protein MHMPM18_000722 [Marteilia pararefringens]